ncbi:sensor histidine kinase [Longirhabdus pacifica]|uniref:sensor histidine kinase n=1 Tax=Longirhabdus pacifica TaxID=2305227 RepID=UPI0010088040|nr:HAMP domain-containing sensor histidine kinase [Longirhabdus pacifica]
MKSIVFKLGMLVVSILLLVLLPLGYVVDQLFYTFYNNKTYEEMEQHVITLVDMRTQMDEETFIEKVEVAMEMVHEQVVYLDESREIVMNEQNTLDSLDIITEEDWLQLQQQNEIIKRQQEHVSYIASPIYNHNEFEGAIFMVTSTDDVDEIMDQVRTSLFVTGIGGLLLALGFTYIIVRKVSMPLLHMEKVTRDMAKGNLNVVLTPSSEDELGTLAHAINDLSRKLKTLEDTRKEFLANISHELRTPLTYMDGYVSLLKEKQSPEERQHTIKIIEEETARLRLIVNDLFDLSKLEEGKISLILEWIDVSEVMESVVEKVTYTAEQKKLALVIKEEPVPLLYADGNRMSQILFNLLDNAIHYTEKGSITVTMKHDDEQLYLFIADTGIGIAEEDVPYIFERFYRVEKSRSRAHGGTGLGLSIVKKLVELQGGTVHVESTYGEGTTFSIIFPLTNKEMEA